MNEKIFTAKPFIDEDTCNSVLEVLRSGMITQGVKVAELEAKFAEYCGVKYSAALNSGTAALHAGLFALGVDKDDEVITSPFTFVASANSILMMGAKPVFADIDEDTFNIDPKNIQNKITAKTKVIMPIHLYGLLSDMPQIQTLANAAKITILEDACQAHGATLNDQKAGSFGDVSAFSLYATKNIMAGEGGVLTSNNESFIENVKSFRHHGQSLVTQYNYTGFGYNYRMTDIHAAIGLSQLKMAENFNRKRLENAAILNKGLSGISGITIPSVPSNYGHVYHQYTIKVDVGKYGRTRDELVQDLQRNNVFPGIFYPKPLHTYPVFQKFGYKEGDFPVSEKISQQVLSLPVHPQITNEDLNRIINIIK
ncbi:DegT/DnrJ/EryC1/StrS aminotransferase family protein [Daejeonella sp.]|uniref:DegT/DnrJ/EryC1/StrS family aminotransferase n=1 Tax=Daejeonella sp. TaxID=2805397 RepID=UPI0027319FC4|nr:DegT/DnrJ/EryC1/StrS family aminotransferase [Daejeonella sp.]MDP2414346.1 DegT/DnrJ/EryC1/StrS family aminotransferase [Daejeonella sp.]